jgi:hypothetical protein
LALGICLHTIHYSTAQNTDNQQLSTQSVDSKLQAANSAVIQAFTAVLDAEKAGANVTDLIKKLNGVSELLAQAEIAYRNGDLNTAEINADSVVSIAQEVQSAAQAEQSAALTSGQNSFLFAVALSVIGGFAFVFILFLLWRRFKRYYINNLSDAKPEVNSQ